MRNSRRAPARNSIKRQAEDAPVSIDIPLEETAPVQEAPEEPIQDEIPQEVVHAEPEVPVQDVPEVVAEEQVAEVVPEVPTVPKNHEVSAEEDDDDDDSDNYFRYIFPVGRNAGASYNSFFPIVFHGAAGRSAGAGADTTAIANSFSTGKRGKASSTATANGEESLRRRSH